MTLTTRTRVVAMLTVVALVLAGTGVFVLVLLRDADRQASATRATATEVPTGPRIVFRSTTIDANNGLVMAVPLADPGGERAQLGPVCDRVDANRTQLVCMRTKPGVTTTFDQRLYVDGRVAETWPLPGIPSRTRLSPSGELVANTVFVNGHSYLQTGFSTATEIRATASGRSLGNLEDWTLTVDGEKFDRRNRNFWGVTFVDDRSFYATAASGDHTWLVSGDVQRRTMTALRSNAECPSVSPDRTRVAYKKLTAPRHWAIAVLDLRTGEETVLGEERSVDDQVAWLDAATLLYGLPRADQPGVTDVWSIDVGSPTEPAGSAAAPRLLIENAWSPAVVA